MSERRELCPWVWCQTELAIVFLMMVYEGVGEFGCEWGLCVPAYSSATTLYPRATWYQVFFYIYSCQIGHEIQRLVDLRNVKNYEIYVVATRFH